nr:amino acid adenylation domain-containing protein [Bacteroidota bacterium]
DKNTLKEKLAKALPNYMVPQIYVELDHLPLTTSGKIDKKALPAPEDTDLNRAKYIAPSTETEQKLATIWENILGIEKIGINDNFFELGGDSIMTTRLAARIRSEFGVDLPIKLVFEHPTIKEISSNFSTLKKTSIPLLTPQLRPEKIPLSFAQERLWFLDSLGGSSNYHMSIVLKLNGSPKKHALKESLRNILTTHEVLRTIILEDGGIGYQHVLETEDFSITEHVKVPPKDIPDLIANIVGSPFDLSSDYMLRAHLLSPSENEHILVCVIHHIASDGWSTPIFFRELSTHYSRLSKGEPTQAFKIPLQYADYSIWQRSYLDGAVLDQKLLYWSNILEDVEELALPTDYIRPPIQSFKGSSHNFVLDSNITKGIHDLTSSTGSSLFITLLGMLNIFLGLYSGQRDICIGTPVANRGQKDLEPMIGFFVNMLALRNSFRIEESFLTFLSRVRDRTLEAYDHQDVPFEKVVNALNLDRDTSRTPLFQVILSLENIPEYPDLSLGDIKMEAKTPQNELSKYDFSINAVERNGQISISFDYCTDLFNSDTVERMANHFINLSRNIVKSPDSSIGTYQILSEEEQYELLENFNTAKLSYPDNITVLDMFRDRVMDNPEATAIIYGEHTMSYHELDYKSTVVARALFDRGIRRGDLVAICTERSLNMLVAILGILKSGAAYVPIDPAYPSKRISYILNDTMCTVLLSDSSVSGSLNVSDSLEVIELDRLDLSKTVDCSQLISPVGDDLAFVIYTSGSTGRPKGVMIEHQSVYDYVQVFVDYFEITKMDTILQQASISFDTSIEEIFPILVAGGTLVIAQENRDFDSLLKECETNNVTILSTNPYAVGYLNEFHDNYNLSLKHIISGGDILKKEQIDQLIKIGYDVYNTYGPTESTVCITYHKVKSLVNPIPIGKPINNKRVYILGENQELVPIGVIGEICVSGKGLARGYLNDVALTKKKFVTHPFIDGERMYRTGDLGRWYPDGSIEFVGRVDEQVKIRGYRIEPEEIESALSMQPGVGLCVIMVKEILDTKHLVAYVESKEDIDKSILESGLKNMLPHYMVPRIYVLVDEFPLTTNGKLDKSALPEPSADDYSFSEYVPPQTDLELELASIWADLLGLDRVGVTDNFFSLGGHSLLIGQLLQQISSKIEVDVPMMEFYQEPTIRHTSSYIKRFEKDKIVTVKGVLTLKKMGENTPNLFIIHDVSGDVSGYKHFINEINDYNSYGLIYPSETLHPVNLSASELAEKYINRIKKIQSEGPYNIVGWSLGGIVATEIALQLEEKGDIVNHLTLIDTYFQPKKPARISEFNVASELDIMKSTFSQTTTFKDKDLSVEKLWKIAIDELKMNNVKLEDLHKNMPEKLTKMLPAISRNNENAIDEFFIHLNAIRTLEYVNNNYVNNRIVKAKTTYFRAKENSVITLEFLKIHFSSITFKKSKHTHFTIMEANFVKEITGYLNDLK